MKMDLTNKVARHALGKLDPKSAGIVIVVVCVWNLVEKLIENKYSITVEAHGVSVTLTPPAEPKA